MELPNQLELQTLFSGFLFEAGLSAVSVKNYLSDLRHFLSFCASISSQDNPPTVQEIFQSVSKYVSQYTDEQRRSFTPQNTINRRLASIRRFSTFLNVKFGLQNEQNFPSHSPVTSPATQNSDDSDVLPTISKILERFRVYLVNEKKTHSTIKNYLSDLNHFFAWSAKQTPFIDQKLENLLSETQLNAYVTYLRLNHTSTSVINRRQSSIKKFTKYCFLQNFIPDNPFENKPEVPKLAPLSWLERLKSKPNNSHKTSRNRFVRLYQRYNSLPFTPYLHLALLVLATSAMVIFGYNQIIKQAAPSAAALPTVPRRQLSFQGRLTDSSGTPIVTAVNVVFKLWNDSTAGTQLYTSNTCSITPDQNGIFNTLIGNGTCGQEIASTVFTENRDVYLEITVGSETLTPRQQIATVGYALNSETLQGYPASATATLNTIPLVDQNGDINIAASSPTINSTSGTFTVTGQALTLSTAANSGGDIILQPDALGGGNVQILGSTTSTDTFRIENANLTSGSLISGYIGNNTATGNLLSLTSGSTETDRFLVGANGRTIINTNGGTDSIFSASSSGTTRFTIASNGNLLATGTLSGLTGLTVASGTVSLPAGEINNTEISELDWTKLQNYPTACPAGQAVQAVGDTLTCVDIAAASGNLWQRTSGSLAPLYTSDSLNLGSTATSSALVHLAGTSGENSWINTGNFGIGTTNPGEKLTVSGGSILLDNNQSFKWNDSTGTARRAMLITGANDFQFGPVDSGWGGNTYLKSGNDIFFANNGASGTFSYPMVIKSAGNVGIGTTNPLAMFQVGTNSTNPSLYVTNTGRVAIGTTNPQAVLHTLGTINGNNALGIIEGTTLSTMRIKSANGTNNNSVLSLVHTGNREGFIAQTVNGLYFGNSGGMANYDDVSLATNAGLVISTTNGISIGNSTQASVNFIDTNLNDSTAASAGLVYRGASFILGDSGIDNRTYPNGLSIRFNNTGVSNALFKFDSANQQFQFGSSNSDGINFDSNAPKMVINTSTGNVGIGLTNPSYKLDVSGDINLTGALRVNGSAGNSGQILSSTGTGLAWIDPSSTAQYWQRTLGSLAPLNITDSLNLGATATSSATVHLAGTSGDNSWINNGNFGIGTTTPTAKLDVAGDASASGSFVLRGTSPATLDVLNGSRFDIQTSAGGDAGLTPRLSINGGGNVGIGLTNPSASLQISSPNTTDTLLLTGGDGLARFKVTQNGSFATNASNGNLYFAGGATGQVQFGSVGSYKLIIDNSSGNVGIGLTNPSYKLDVAGDVNLTGALRASGNAGNSGQILSSTGTGVQWIDAPSGTGTNDSPFTWNTGVIYPLSITDALNLGNSATSSATVHLAGTSGDNSFINTGNFGIGITNPGAKLEVVGNTLLSNTSQFQIKDSSGNARNVATINAANNLYLGDTAGSNVFLTSGGNNDIAFRDNTDINLFIQGSTGNVGIGTTTPTAKLDVAGDINVTGALRDNGSAGTNGQVLTSTGTGIQWVDQSAISGTQLWQYNGGVLTPVDINGAINLGATATNSAYVHLAGKSGDNSFVNTGNFGIGLTNPGSKLTVNGTLTSSGGAINLNDSSNFATNINTGTSTGAVTIGGGSNTVAINSSSWDISTAGAISGVTTINMSGQLTSTVATGTAPFAVSSTTVNTNLNADLLDGFHASYFAPLTNIAGTTNRMAKFTGANSVGNASINDLYNNVTMTIDASGNIGIGTTTPSNLLSVGTGSGFQVDGTGAIMNANGATISGSVRLSALGSGILHSNASGYLSSSAINLASSDVTGLLPIINGGTNNSTFTTGKFVAYDGTKLASTSFDETSFETALTFQNGLTRTGSTVEFGGTNALLHDTLFDQSTYDLAFIGSGNFGIGAASPSQKLDVAGFFVVDTTNSRVGIGTTTPNARVEIAGSSSTISNTSGDITFNAASNLFNFSGDTLGNFLNATASGQIRLGNFTDAGRPATNGAGNLIYSTTQQAPQYYNGTTWKTLTNYFNRTAEGILYPSTWNDSINLFASTGDGASSSAKIRLSGDSSNNTFFNTPVAIGFTTAMESTAILQTSGSILPKNTAANNNLGKIGYSWANLFLNGGISDDTGLQILSASNRRLTGANWNVTGNLGVGSTTSPTHALEVTGTTNLSGVVTTGANLYVGGTDLEVNGGTGKINVGTIDPPYTINGQKYATYLASMVGVKEEVVGKVSTAQADYISGVGYRILLDLDQQPTGSDLWLFSKTTNIQLHINDLSVLLTPEGQARAWYELDTNNKILAIYSSTPANITYRLTAPRFDAANWANTRTNSTVGFVINDYNNYSNTASIFDTTSATPELLAKIDGTFSLSVNGKEIREVSSFAESLIANLKAGAAVITNLVTDNLTVRTKLVSPLADIDQLKVIDATVSGTLYADNIQGKTVDSLHQEINLLNEKYSTASAILSDLQAKYGTYGELLGSFSSATVSADPLALSPLATTSTVIPSDLALNSLNVQTVIANDVMANGSVFAQAISSYDTDLFIQPTGDKAVHLAANIMSIYPNGKVLVNGDLLVNGTLLAQAIDTQTATVSGTLAVGTSTIATDSANFNQLTTTGLIIAAANDSATQSGSTQTASNATIGSATIATGAAEINIANTRITDSTLIYVTPTSDTNGSVLFVKAKQTGAGFTVAISGAVNPDAISFNYWLVETK